MDHDEYSGGIRPAPERDGRPAGATESSSQHVFVVRDGEYACVRCGRRMTPEALEETCPQARPES